MNRRLLSAVILLIVSAAGTWAGKNGTSGEGWAAYEAGRYEDAYNAFSQLVREEPNSEDVNFGLGMAALQIGKLSHARFAFERVLAINPGNQRARLELARTCVAMGQYDTALSEFEHVLDFNPPERVRTNVERYMDQIRRLRRPWMLSGQLNLAVFHDDNINYGPSSRFIDTRIGELEVATNSQPQESWGVALGGAAGGTYDVGRKGDWMLAGGLAGYRNWLESDAAAQEITYWRGQAGARMASQRVLADLPLKLEYLDLGSDPLVMIYGAEPSLILAPTMDWNYITQLAGEYREYRDQGDRSGPSWRANQSVRRFFGPHRHSATMNIGYFYEDADNDGYSNGGPLFTASGELNILPRAVLYALAEYRISDYREILLSDLQDEERHDEQFQVMAGLRYAISTKWGTDLNYRRVNNDSNFGLYEYTRNVFTLSTFVLF
jgi:tetratricopeptide (TPR) repeat protein